ncbi:sigma-70 family RNA polymerase sigma factor [Lentzea sp. NPDC034063]|uniref:sigma-70 family RNA polymerase sigma factor n=1 Tax=unclassified Lentzea TaxID=2643253 RepID=UPI0033D596EA
MSSPTEVRDEALVRSLYRTHGQMLLSYVTRLTGGDWATAEDVVQETFMRAWQHPEVFRRSDRPVRGWLMTVARNLLIDKARARSKRPREVPYACEEHTESDRTEHVLNSIVVFKALSRLSFEQREVLLQTYLCDRTFSNAAAGLGIREGTAKSRAHYAISALRHILSGQDDLIQS